MTPTITNWAEMPQRVKEYREDAGLPPMPELDVPEAERLFCNSEDDAGTVLVAGDLSDDMSEWVFKHVPLSPEVEALLGGRKQ